MNSDDFKQIQKIIREEIAPLDKRLSSVDERVSVMDERVTDSEKRLKNLITETSAASEKRIIGAIGIFISDQVLPLIDEKADKVDIDRLERKIDKALDTSIDHESRLQDIEQIPVVAHELKRKKRK